MVDLLGLGIPAAMPHAVRATEPVAELTVERVSIGV
jgi:hypothetical protein